MRTKTGMKADGERVRGGRVKEICWEEGGMNRSVILWFRLVFLTGE